MQKLADLRKQRATAFDAFKALATQETLSDEDRANYGAREAEVRSIDDQIKRYNAAQALAADTAVPVAGQEATRTVPAAAENDPYVKERSLVIGGIAKMLGAGGGTVFGARQVAQELYGENHPVTRALATSSGTAGGFILPPDYANEVIELLRAQTVVRSSQPRVIPMPRGTMTLPGQASAASASYGAENARMSNSQQSLNQIVASFKKMTALVPVSNDMMRYASPAVDAFVRDDLVKVVGLRQDLAFLLGDGTQDSPMGFLGFANRWVKANGGTVGNWLPSSSATNSTLAVNAADPANSTGGNFITSNATYTLATVAQELGGAINRLDAANVPQNRRVWFLAPRSKNYLFNVQNSLGVYVYREEMTKGTLLGYPFKITTQIPVNYRDASGTNLDLSFVILAEMDEALIFDAMTMELSVSREGTYVDGGGTTVSAFQNDQTLIRAIAEHDFQMRHDQSVAIIQAVRWAPAIG